jgi:hypothetical protein
MILYKKVLIKACKTILFAAFVIFTILFIANLNDFINHLAGQLLCKSYSYFKNINLFNCIGYFYMDPIHNNFYFYDIRNNKVISNDFDFFILIPIAIVIFYRLFYTIKIKIYIYISMFCIFTNGIFRELIYKLSSINDYTYYMNFFAYFFWISISLAIFLCHRYKIKITSPIELGGFLYAYSIIFLLQFLGILVYHFLF